MSDDELRAAIGPTMAGGEVSHAMAGILSREGVARLLRTAAAMAERLLALLPPSDDGEPVTTGWLEDIGFRHIESLGGAFVIDNSEGEGWVLANLTINNTWKVGRINIPDQPTRGHVRRLCSALSIPLTEPPPCSSTATETATGGESGAEAGPC